MGRPPLGEPLAIEAEIRAERASALKHAASQLEAALRELASIEAKLDASPGSDRAGLVAAHARARAEAEKWRWYLVVQREAMGMRHHAVLFEIYPIPPRRS